MCCKTKDKRTGSQDFYFVFFIQLQPNYLRQNFLLSLKMLLKVISLYGQLQERQIANHYSKQIIFFVNGCPRLIILFAIGLNITAYQFV